MADRARQFWQRQDAKVREYGLQHDISWAIARLRRGEVGAFDPHLFNKDINGRTLDYVMARENVSEEELDQWRKEYAILKNPPR